MLRSKLIHSFLGCGHFGDRAFLPVEKRWLLEAAVAAAAEAVVKAEVAAMVEAELGAVVKRERKRERKRQQLRQRRTAAAVVRGAAAEHRLHEQRRAVAMAEAVETAAEQWAEAYDAAVAAAEKEPKQAGRKAKQAAAVRAARQAAAVQPASPPATLLQACRQSARLQARSPLLPAKRGRLRAPSKKELLHSRGWVIINARELLEILDGSRGFREQHTGEGIFESWDDELGDLVHSHGRSQGRPARPKNTWSSKISAGFAGLLRKEGMLQMAAGTHTHRHTQTETRAHPARHAYTETYPPLPHTHPRLRARVCAHAGGEKVVEPARKIESRDVGKQLDHADSARKDTLSEPEVADEDVPLALLYALQDDTPLHVFDRFSDESHILLLMRGELLVFRGDLGHAGAAYGGEANERVHAYVDSPNFRLDTGKTFAFRYDTSGQIEYLDKEK